jgi:Ca2+-binding RTX toxin-like protein
MTTVLLTASTSGSVIDAQRLVVFTWRPEPGATTLNYTQDGGSGLSVSDARGHVAFLGATMHEPFTARPARIEFSFTNHASATNYTLRDAGSWSWTPETGVLDPNGASGTGPSWISTQMRFTATEAQAERAAYSTDPFSGVIEHGRWVPLETAPQLRMWGSAGPDLLAGGAGDDTLVGGEMGGVPRLGGGDTLRGGAGNDRAEGEAGDDLIEMGEGRDLASGGSGNDTIRGGAGHDTLLGFVGDDLILGEDGNDVLNPGEGFDTLDGGEGFDTLDLRVLDGQGRDVAAPVDMVVRLDGGYAAPDQRGWLRQISISNIEAVIGSRGCDVIVGDAGQNVLDGGGGVENTLTGGGGADRFVLGRGQSLALRLDGTPVAPLTQDWITDFRAAEGDRIDLRHFGVTAAAVSLVEAWGDLHIHLADAAGGLHQVATLYGLTAAAMGPSWMIV